MYKPKKIKLLVLTPLVLLVMAAIGYGITVLFMSLAKPLGETTHYAIVAGEYVCETQSSWTVGITQTDEQDYLARNGIDTIADTKTKTFFVLSVNIDEPLHTKNVVFYTVDPAHQVNDYGGQLVDRQDSDQIAFHWLSTSSFQVTVKLQQSEKTGVFVSKTTN